MAFSLKIDDREMRRFIRTMPKAGTRAVVRSLNKAIDQTRTLAVRQVSRKRNILVGRAREEMRVQHASTTRPEAAINASGQPIKAIEVKGPKRQTKRGVIVNSGVNGKPHLFEDCFLATMPSGHTGVFRRPGKTRLKIKEQVLPSVSSTMLQPDISDPMREHAAKVYEAELERQLNFEMKKAGAR